MRVPGYDGEVLYIMKKRVLFGVLVCMLIGITACSKENEEMTYKQITMSEAQEIFETPGDYIILDVRTVEEYEAGRIPGAICVPNETIRGAEIDELPDKDQLIYVYCRSGNRSKQAADKLVKKGYTNIVEFGGIKDWSGEIEK